MMFKSSGITPGRKASLNPKKRRSITVNSYLNSRKKILNALRSEAFIENSIVTCIDVHTKSLFKNINFQKETDTKSSIGINIEITDDNNTSEEISFHQDSEKVIDHTCDENVNNVLNI